MGGGFDGGYATQYDEVCERDFFAVGGAGVEFLLDFFQGGEDAGEISGFIDFPVFLWGEADSGAVGSAALIGVSEGGGGRPSRIDKVPSAQARL